MNTISQGKIFLSNQRSIIENDHIKRYSTFNFDNSYHPEKEPIGNLYALHDDLLAPNAVINFFHREKGYITIVPIVGTVIYIDDNEKQSNIEVGQSMTTFLTENSFFKLRNPYGDASVSYLIIGVKNEETQPSLPVFIPIDLAEQNHLIKVTPTTVPYTLSLGRFKEKGESKYELNEQAVLYCFVLSGAFEIDNKLLQERDGMALWATKEIEIKALSNNAILLSIALTRQLGIILF